VDAIYTATGPRPGVMLVGTVATNTPASPFGNLVGEPAVVSIGFTSDTPPKINNVVVVIAGQVVQFSGTGGGTVTFTNAPVTPPGSGAGPTIVVAVSSPTAIRVVNLDASATTGSNLPLKFHWSVVAGAADIANAESAFATGYILGGAGTYTFRVTVTDSKGNSNFKDVDVQFQ
jgi:K319-like protein